MRKKKGNGNWVVSSQSPWKIPGSRVRDRWYGMGGYWFYSLKISYTNLPRKRRGRSWACSWEAEISKIPWKQIIQTMTGHKSNSFLKPLISLKEIFFFFWHFSFQGRRGRKREIVVKQWALLIRIWREIAVHSLRGGGGEWDGGKQKYKRIGKNYS